MRHLPILQSMSRRQFLQASACGFGSLALGALCAEQAAAANPLAPRMPQFAPRARRVIFMFIQGGPSHMDMFDYKPRLQKQSGEELPFKLPHNEEAPGLENTRLLGPVSPFSRHGQAGLWITDYLPHLARHADQLCVLNGMQADNPAHAPAVMQLHTGATNFIRPSIGSWITYGLGTENQNLPGFMTICPMISGDGGTPQNFGSAFLPAFHQGVPIGHAGIKAAQARIRHLGDTSLPPAMQRRYLDLVQSMNRDDLARLQADQQMEGVIESFELAFRMQAEAPGLMDISGESKGTLDLYGIGGEPTDNFGRQCLLARRFAEAGVRFIEITSTGWDHHGKIRESLPANCAQIDKPIAGLLSDLQARGLLDDTLLVWCGEFGRTPYSQDLSMGKESMASVGREHNPRGFTAWLAGGGVKGGVAYGQTDEFGYHAVDGQVHIHDLHATILHLLGLDHEKLTYRYAGRDFRLTDVFGRVVREILA